MEGAGGEGQSKQSERRQAIEKGGQGPLREEERGAWKSLNEQFQCGEFANSPNIQICV